MPAITVAGRIIIGALGATAVATLAARAGALRRSGALAAIVVGTAACAAGWGWGVLVIAYFVPAALLGRLASHAASASDGDPQPVQVIAKLGARDARQVLANGGLFAALAIGATLTKHPFFIWGALGALAASSADTWATELGTFAGGTPRHMLTGRPVPPGTSGGITWTGTLGALLGATWVATAGWVLGWPAAAAGTALVAGFAGAMADSLLGATAQMRRYCPACHTATEQPRHTCGTLTEHAGGLPWIDNDVVNVFATLVGATIAAAGALSAGALSVGS